MTVASPTAQGYFLSLRWKLIIPFAFIVLLVLLVLLPLTSLLIQRRVEQEADSRLEMSARSVTQLLLESEQQARLSVNFAANLPEIRVASVDVQALAALLPARRDELGLQELSFYAADFQPGDAALFYGGPPVTRRLQVSQNTTNVREGLLLAAMSSSETQSGIAISPQSSQIIGVAPLHTQAGQRIGLLMAVFYLDESYVQNISTVLGADVGLVKDNAIIASTFGHKTDLSKVLADDFIPDTGSSAQNIQFNGTPQRLMAYPLVLHDTPQGTVLVAQSLDDLSAMRNDILWMLGAFAAVVVLVSLLFSIGAVLGFARPVTLLAAATDKIRSGDLSQRVPPMNMFVQDEVTVLSDNFNAMVEQLEGLYRGLEERVHERTRELEAAMEALELARDEALAANRAKSVFLANMSHELRTPLNAIIGYANLVTAGTYGAVTETQMDRLQRVVDNGHHLLNLINDILDLSKIEAGKMELYLERFEVNHMLDNVISTTRPLVAKNSNQMETHFAANLGGMFADLTKVRQVLINLIGNAAKFTKEGTIQLSVARQMIAGRESIVFTVRDTGIGMTPEQVKRLFQEFSQADSSTTRKYGGTGLGLAISRHFCEMMEGSISVESQFGEGSVFTVTLPATVDPARDTSELKPVSPTTASTATQATAQVSAQVGAMTRASRVLVIDDDATARDLIQHYLSAEGFEVLTASTGERGIELAQETMPAVITLDVMMANLDGWSVLQRLKEDPTTAHIPVIMLTIVDDRKKGYALGASNYLTKPIDPTRLTQVLNQYRCGTEDCPVLVVEDEPHTRKMMADLLEAQGWAVDVAENGQVALNCIAERIPAVILLDLMMPEMDGFEFIETVRRDENLRDIPIIVVTAMNLSREDHLRIDGYIRKIVQKGQYNQHELLHEVRDLINIRLNELSMEG